MIGLDTTIILQMLFLLAPAGIGNTAPVWGAKLPGLKHWSTPIDMGLSLSGRRLLGANKTWRGLVVATATGALTGGILAIVAGLSGHIGNEVDIFSRHINLIPLGALLGLSALLGDAVKSFFKRRLDIRPGRPWFPMDQIDYILGAYVAVWFLFDLTLTHYLVGLVVYALLHPVLSYAAYLLKLKKDRF